MIVAADRGVMVNTRRTDSIGPTPDTSRKAESSDSTDVSESENDSPWGSPTKSKRLVRNKKTRSSVRELRSRFVYDADLRNDDLNERNRHTLDERHSLRVYSARNIRNTSVMYNASEDEDDDNMYERKRRRSRHLIACPLDTMERRTALSLRPIRQKCYADSSDIELRRSTRQRKVPSENMSWLADDQMHKVGYPNLNVPDYFEDSRDAAETHIEESRRITRLSTDSKRREIKNPKYLYDYETNDVSSRRRRTTLSSRSNDRPKRELRSRRDLIDKENNVTTRMNGRHERLRRGNISTATRDDNEDKGTEENAEDEMSDSKVIQENGNGEAVNEELKKEDEAENKSSSSETISRLRTREQQKKIMMDMKRKRKDTTRESFDESSSSQSEEIPKGYSLRNRQPKPLPLKSTALRSREHPSRSRRRFNRRRKPSESSTSSSSNSDACQKTKLPKNQHSKNDQKMKSGGKIIPIGPETLDTNVRFSSIGGLDGHIQCLKEMILLPMMYPEVFRQFQIQPPRGVLFHGPPGTGKTLLARALANECSLGCKKVSFFMRKGADLLSKWIGESEKQLRLLFAQASEMQPSIIFFDELDGLAPVRSSRQDQIHASIVSTLLALMDGLDDRGEVIVIGATNRIDSIDPALRRPGRFDRELFFPLPAMKEREAIIRVHVSKWSKPPNEELLSYLGQTSVGYCGSDLRALCTEAVIQAFRRVYPQVYSADHRLLLNAEMVQVEKIDFLRAKALLIPASQRVTQGLGRKLLLILEPLLNDAVKSVFELLEDTFPHALNPVLSKVKLSPNIRPAQLLLLGETPNCGQTSHLAPAVLYKMEHIHSYVLDLASLYKETGRSAEEACIQVFSEARRNVPSVVYIPNIDNWWELLNDTVKAILNSQLSQLDPNIPFLLLATAENTYENLPAEIQGIFSRYRKEVYQLDLPDAASREAFFRPLLIDSCLKAPRPPRIRQEALPTLPRAPTPPPTPLSEAQSKKLYETEEHTLRELRIFLRDMCKKLATNKLFFMFTKPVDTEEVPDYPNIIKEPMDLETMMTKVDFHKYQCAKDFLQDIELIVQNALEYNPAKTSADKQIRHRACSLRDYAYTIIKNEMDSDFEDKCQNIASTRKERKCVAEKYLPAYIQTPDNVHIEGGSQPNEASDVKKDGDVNEPIEGKNVSINNSGSRSSLTKKKRSNNWQKGYCKPRKRTKISMQDEPKPGSSDDSKENDLSMSPPVDISDAKRAENETDTSNIEAPLLIHCDLEGTINENSSHLPTRRLSDLMSPSELLSNPVDFDEIDQALNEDGQTAMLLPVQCDTNSLAKLLKMVVESTEGCPLQLLLDLYNQLSRIVKKYSSSYQRTNLPKELQQELARFKNEASPDSADTE